MCIQTKCACAAVEARRRVLKTKTQCFPQWFAPQSGRRVFARVAGNTDSPLGATREGEEGRKMGVASVVMLGLGCLLLAGAQARDMAAYCGGKLAASLRTSRTVHLQPRTCAHSPPPPPACKAVVDELQYAIKQEDPKKTFQVSPAL